ncbi:hypothetical protein CLV63_14125 [Murinocardiopsis flavida]|uniref:Uncharacterized protein n=1 Tax=Murinocardiopsis flavida TaxID=645275 RepID=A0A2P8CDS6_9ACTN|nr:hypothetical protein [Murinocardiopsis flavida]PSK83059.1 hypothetical protein CLV63_14125 [Murinocardiopsis flavida]
MEDLARRQAARDIAADPEFGDYIDPDFAEELFDGVFEDRFAVVVDVPLPAFEDAGVLAA